MALFFAVLVLLHSPFLRLPYFWDEAGYYIPAARDILLTGSLIPTSTLSNAHPPLLLAYLAAAWKVFGYSPMVARCSMLLVSAFCLLGVYCCEICRIDLFGPEFLLERISDFLHANDARLLSLAGRMDVAL